MSLTKGCSNLFSSIFIMKRGGNYLLTACGMNCSECDFFQKYCEGCSYVKGHPFWVLEVPSGRCDIFYCCVNEKRYRNCGECEDLPCEMFKSLKDPNVSKEVHLQLLEIRVDRLKTK